MNRTSADTVSVDISDNPSIGNTGTNPTTWPGENQSPPQQLVEGNKIVKVCLIWGPGNPDSWQAEDYTAEAEPAARPDTSGFLEANPGSEVLDLDDGGIAVCFDFETKFDEPTEGTITLEFNGQTYTVSVQGIP